ncbi:phenylalanine--tRNA ligase subunit alpha [Candidatus Saccharibacteria bacterium]|nr:MAG: phenylalanine--tRNA ligase subunit alpha [Candidatus Saccharibacteria bacterium]
MIDTSKLKSELLLEISSTDAPRTVLRSDKLKDLYSQIPTLPPEQRGDFGRLVNQLKNELEQAVVEREAELSKVELEPIDVTAPMDVNSNRPEMIAATDGSQHPLSQEITKIADIFNRMGYLVEESREVDDQFHMFESLNFPKGHPARDDYDTFMTEEVDENGDRLIAPAHTSTMQNRILKKYRSNLDKGEAIAAIVPDRVFRNEDLDSRHEHTFYQIEGVYVAKNVTVGNLIATLKEFLQEYYQQDLDVRVNPFYFPFTEPSFEFALSCPFCKGQDDSCKVCSGEGWVELLGCGLIHLNVLKMADIDPSEYTGFAFGCGIDRLIMMKHQIEDIRHLESAKLDFLKQF